MYGCYYEFLVGGNYICIFLLNYTVLRCINNYLLLGAKDDIPVAKRSDKLLLTEIIFESDCSFNASFGCVDDSSIELLSYVIGPCKLSFSFRSFTISLIFSDNCPFEKSTLKNLIKHQFT